MKKLIKAIKKELRRSATSTTDALFLNMLGRDLKNKDFDTDRVRKVKQKYDL